MTLENKFSVLVNYQNTDKSDKTNTDSATTDDDTATVSGDRKGVFISNEPLITGTYNPVLNEKGKRTGRKKKPINQMTFSDLFKK